MPRFSIILPCYNAASTILDTLEGLEAQTFTDWEAICVDDGSTDATRALIESAAEADPRIRLIRNTGIGPSHARNIGVEFSTGDLIAFCDADDIWVSRKLSDLNQVFTHTTVDAAYGQVVSFEEASPEMGVFSTVSAGDLRIEALLSDNPVSTISNIALRRSAFDKTDGFDPSLAHNEDLEWLIRLVGGGARVVGIPALHTLYRTSIDGLSTDHDAMRSGRKRVIKTAARFGVASAGRIPDLTHHHRSALSAPALFAAHQASSHPFTGANVH